MLRRRTWCGFGLGFALTAGLLVLASCGFSAHSTPLPPAPTLYFCSGFTASNCVASFVPSVCAGGGWDIEGNCALTNCVAPITGLFCSAQ